ncbi:MAG: hypothetical protein AB1Z18_12805 [Desulfobacterales bacterium]
MTFYQYQIISYYLSINSYPAALTIFSPFLTAALTAGCDMPNFSAKAIWLNPLLYECTVSPSCRRDGVAKQFEHRCGILPAPMVSAKHGAVACIRIAVQLLKFGNHAGTQGI